MKKLCLAVYAVFAFTVYGVYADVLGTVTDSFYNDMGAYSTFHRTQFDGGNAGRQTDHYIEYAPNDEATPVVVSGGALWGSKNILTANEWLESNGQRAVAGINADFFSYKTGLQMGYTISEGRLISKDLGPQPAIGFTAEGKPFIDTLDVKTTAYKDDVSVEIQYINKWCQAGFDPIYLLTPDFGESTHTESECIFVLCDIVEGNFAVEGETKLKVSDSFEYNGAIKIPEDKVILLMDKTGTQECYAFLSALAVGDEFTVRNEVVGAEKNLWSTAAEATSTTGVRLLKDGQICTFTDEAANPRTAVGVKENGNLIMYTLDGRQSGYSYGCRLETLAKRMAELGCVDAINLDGGGSTTIAARLSGSDDLEVENSPSDGSLRSVSNFIFLKDNRTPTDDPWIINASLDATDYLTGATAKVTIDSVYDTANYKMENPVVDISCDIGEVQDNEVKFTIGGVANISLDEGTLTLNCNVYDSPEEIRVYNRDTMNTVSAVYAEANEELSLNLLAVPMAEGREIKTDAGQIKWFVTGNVGEINEDGVFVMKDTLKGKGAITVTIGAKSVEIPVVIGSEDCSFKDTAQHWAKDVIETMAGESVLTGEETEDGRYFYPDRNMTRAEFAVVMCRLIGANAEEYADDPSVFADEADIPDWALDQVKAMYARGMINGKNSEYGVMFMPSDSISRAEAMTIIGRMFDSEAQEVSFADSDLIPDWAEEGICRLVTMGIVHGYDDNTIRPNNSVTRAEAAVMLYNAKENMQ